MFNQLGGAGVNPNKDLEVTSPPEDTVSALEFSPPSVPQTFLVAGSWDCRVRNAALAGFGLLQFIFCGKMYLRTQDAVSVTGAVLGGGRVGQDGTKGSAGYGRAHSRCCLA